VGEARDRFREGIDVPSIARERSIASGVVSDPQMRVIATMIDRLKQADG
jgi:hypothetical protein